MGPPAYDSPQVCKMYQCTKKYKFYLFDINKNVKGYITNLLKLKNIYYNEVAISNKMCFCGEVGLNGEIRSIGKIESRIAEAEKLGFSEIIISKYNTEYIEKKNYSIKISGFEKLSDAYSYVIKKP